MQNQEIKWKLSSPIENKTTEDHLEMTTIHDNNDMDTDIILVQIKNG